VKVNWTEHTIQLPILAGHLQATEAVPGGCWESAGFLQFAVGDVTDLFTMFCLLGLEFH